MADDGGLSIPLPRDFLEEVQMELRHAKRHLCRTHARFEVLEELHRLSLAIATERRGLITVFDVIRSAASRDERERRLALVRRMRSDVLEPGRNPD